MQKKLQQFKNFVKENPLLFLCLLLLFFLPIYSGEIVANSQAYIFGKYINYLHIRISIHLILSFLIVFRYFYVQKEEKGFDKKSVAWYSFGLLLLVLLPLFSILQLPIANKGLFYFSSVFHLIEFLLVATALIICIKQLLTTSDKYKSYIVAIVWGALGIQLFFGMAQFMLKGPLLPQLLSWTGQPLRFTSNSIIGIFEYARIYGTTPHPNILAGILVFYALIVLAINSSQLSKLIQILLIGILLLGTLSKTGIVALLLLLIHYFFRAKFSALNLTRPRIITLFLLINLVILIFFSVVSRSSTPYTFIDSRAVIQRLYLDLLTHYPNLLLTGTGFTLAIPTLLAKAFSLPTSTIWGNQILAEPPHNILLLGIVELGIPAFIIVFLSTIKKISLYFSGLPLWQKQSLFLLVLTLGALDHFLIY